MEPELRPWKTNKYKSPAERKFIPHFNQNSPYKPATFKNSRWKESRNNDWESKKKNYKEFEHGPDLCMSKTQLYRVASYVKRVGIQNVQPMTHEQYKKVNKALIKEISKMENGTGPSFFEIFYKNNCIIVACTNQASRDWIVETIPKLKPWPEADLSIMSNRQLPLQIASAYISLNAADSIEGILHLLQVQNRGINIDQWKVLTEKTQKKGRLLTFSMDFESVEALKENGFRASIGLSRALFKFDADQHI